MRRRALSSVLGAFAVCFVLSGCGPLWGWGANSDGGLGIGEVAESAEPIGVTSPTFRSVDVGQEGSCAIDLNGGLYCWGVSTRDQPPVNVPTRRGDETWLEVDVRQQYVLVGGTGRATACAIRSDRSIWCWDDNIEPRMWQVSDREWSTLAMGAGGLCAINNDSTLWCWSDPGQLLWGTGQQVGTPGWRTISGSGLAQVLPEGRPDRESFCGIKEGGSRWCLGTNDNGQLGTGSYGPEVLTPVLADGASWIDLSLDPLRSCGVRTDGSLWCWGRMQDSVSRGTPARVGTSNQWTSVNTGGGEVCALQADGSAWCTNPNILGFAKELSRFGDGLWSSIATSGRHACGVDVSTTVACWGLNTNSQLGVEGPQDRYTPTLVNAGYWTKVATINNGACGIASDRSLWCWGFRPPAQWEVRAPSPIGQAEWIDIDLGSFVDPFACGVQANNTLWCWGGNLRGQLGNGTTTDADAPTQVGGTDWQSVATGRETACAIKLDETLWCWGDGQAGQIGGGVPETSSIPKQVGSATWKHVALSDVHVCGIQTDDSLWCWGRNRSRTTLGDPNLGQELANGSNQPVVAQLTPARIGDASWRTLDAGFSSTCGIQTDDTLWCWGGDFGTGEVQARPTPIDSASWQTVSTHRNRACGVQTDGSLWCWGYGSSGSLGLGRQLETVAQPTQVGDSTGWSAVDVSEDHSFAIGS